MSQGKLVRDRIPQIIQSKGLEPIVYSADTDEYAARLRGKLSEEVAEFLESDSDPEELADILEVLYALAEQVGIGRQQLEKLRRFRRPDHLVREPSCGCRHPAVGAPLLQLVWVAVGDLVGEKPATAG